MFAFAAYFAVVDRLLAQGDHRSPGLLHEIGDGYGSRRERFTSKNSREDETRLPTPDGEQPSRKQPRSPPKPPEPAEALSRSSPATTKRRRRSGSSSTPIRDSRTRWPESLRTRAEAFGFADKIGQILIPTEEVVELRNGKKVTSKRLVYPGYVLVEMEMNDALWHEVKNTPRVTGLRGRRQLAGAVERG